MKNIKVVKEKNFTLLYKNKFIDYWCNDCNYEGNGFQVVDEYFINNEGIKDTLKDFAECPKCNHQSMIM